MAIRSEQNLQLATLTTEATTNTPPAKKPIGLLYLPAELREDIYRYALVRPSAIHVLDPLGCLEGEAGTANAWLERHKRSRTRSAHRLALLQVSRQVRSEAMPIFHGLNTFLFTHLHTMFNWLWTFAEERHSMVKKLRLFPFRWYALPATADAAALADELTALFADRGVYLREDAIKIRGIHPEHGLMDDYVWMDATGKYEVEQALPHHWPEPGSGR